jgi:hypothetical protein
MKIKYENNKMDGNMKEIGKRASYPIQQISNYNIKKIK